jgi:hypothetical protein
MWKEYKEVFAQRCSRAVALFVVPIFLMGVFLPWQTGLSWLNTPTTMLIWAWLPAFLVVAIIVDSFAGERERHTLETLLASTLPDRAILLGKIGMSVLYSWTMTLAGMAVALVTVNLMYGGGGLLMYSTDVLLVGVVLSALISVMVATVGTLISLRSATVRQAQQIQAECKTDEGAKPREKTDAGEEERDLPRRLQEQQLPRRKQLPMEELEDPDRLKPLARHVVPDARIVPHVKDEDQKKGKR